MRFNPLKRNKKSPLHEFVTVNEFNQLKRQVDTHQSYLNNIYIFHELEFTPFLDAMRELSYGLMIFFDNVCRKYDLEYWMDYGTLLGAIRHEGFVPWDDDLDVGMMRADILKLADIFQSEIDENGLENVNCAYKIDKHDHVSQRWFQINVKRPEFNGKFVGIDVFPYDYIKNPENVEEKYYDSRANFYKRRQDGMDIKDVVDELFNELGLSYEKEENIIPGVENARGKVNIYPFKVIKTDKLFPIKRVKFGKCMLPAPQDAPDYLLNVYGKRFMEIPGKIRDHGRLNRYKKQPDIMNMLKETNEMFRRVNENFKF